jgi:hypothetical protein
MLQTTKQLAFYVIWLWISFSCSILDITHPVDCYLLLLLLSSSSSSSPALQPSADYGLIVSEVSWSHTTRLSRKDSSGRVIRSSQRPIPDNTQQTNIHAPGGIRTHYRSRRAAVDQRLRPCGHWDRRPVDCIQKKKHGCDSDTISHRMISVVVPQEGGG